MSYYFIVSIQLILDHSSNARHTTFGQPPSWWFGWGKWAAPGSSHEWGSWREANTRSHWSQGGAQDCASRSDGKYIRKLQELSQTIIKPVKPCAFLKGQEMQELKNMVRTRITNHLKVRVKDHLFAGAWWRLGQLQEILAEYDAIHQGSNKRIRCNQLLQVFSCQVALCHSARQLMNGATSTWSSPLAFSLNTGSVYHLLRRQAIMSSWLPTAWANMNGLNAINILKLDDMCIIYTACVSFLVSGLTS